MNMQPELDSATRRIVWILAAVLLVHGSPLFCQSFPGREHVFIIEMDSCNPAIPNHQLGVKVKGFMGILTTARGLLLCNKLTAFDHKGVAMDMRIRSISLDQDLAVLECVYRGEGRPPGEFVNLRNDDYGLVRSQGALVSGAECSLVQVDSIELRNGRFGSSFLPTPITPKAMVLAGLAQDHTGLRDELLATSVPTKDLPIYAWTLENRQAAKRKSAKCLEGAPLIVPGTTPILIGLAGGHYGKINRLNNIWAVDTQVLKDFGRYFRSKDSWASSEIARYRKFATTHAGGADSYSLKNQEQPKYGELPISEKALREALLRIRNKLREAAGVEYSSIMTAGNDVCGTGWIDLENLTDAFRIPGKDKCSFTRFPATIALIRFFKFTYCHPKGGDKERTAYANVREVLDCLNRELGSLDPEDTELWYDVELDIEEVRRFARARTVHYLQQDFCKRVRRQAASMTLADSCLEIPALLREIDEWTSQMGRRIDDEPCKELRGHRAKLEKLRANQLDRRYSAIRKQRLATSAAVQLVNSDVCLEQSERGLILQRLEKDARNERTRNALLQNTQFGSNLSMAIANRFVRRALIDETAPYHIAVTATDSSCTISLLVSSTDSLVFSVQRNAIPRSEKCVTDSIKLVPYAYPLGAYMFPGAYALLQEFSSSVDSLWQSRQSEFDFAQLSITGGADGVRFRKQPYLPDSWLAQMPLALNSDQRNEQLAYARAYAAQEVLRQNEWARTISTAAQGVHVQEIGKKHRNVRIELVFERAKP